MALPILAHWAAGAFSTSSPRPGPRGIRLLLADLDNTLAPYGEPSPHRR